MIDWNEILTQVIQLLLVPLFLYGLKIAEGYLKRKIKVEQIRSITDQVIHAVEIAVAETSQTYVNVLKEQGKFDERTAKLAFEMARHRVNEVLTPKAEEILSRTINDVNTYINSLIEAEVLKQKGEN